MMEKATRKPLADLTMKDYLSRACKWVSEHWTSGAFYTPEAIATDEDGYEEAYAATEGGHIYGDLLAEAEPSVCAVGAMRVAFAEIVQMPADGTDEYGDWWYETTIMNHPFYFEGMRVLGRAFYELEQKHGSLEEPEKLLNGQDGHSYTMDDVTTAVVSLNDDYWDRQLIVEAFERAVELAPDQPMQLT